MIALASILIFIGFYCLYSGSKKATLNTSVIDNWFQKENENLKFVGPILLIAALVISVLEKGFASGIFLWFIILMTIGSLIVILSPLKILNYKTVLASFIFIVIIENFIL
ncbi:DUF3325 family protein [Joostella sp.]|uniref:DUF3325 family protein n=1 Tax=Joostella sp. TaxID=2231138 RepID=UPI003A8CDF94